jgi:hypothetical protein
MTSRMYPHVNIGFVSGVMVTVTSPRTWMQKSPPKRRYPITSRPRRSLLESSPPWAVPSRKPKHIHAVPLTACTPHWSTLSPCYCHSYCFLVLPHSAVTFSPGNLPHIAPHCPTFSPGLLLEKWQPEDVHLSDGPWPIVTCTSMQCLYSHFQTREAQGPPMHPIWNAVTCKGVSENVATHNAPRGQGFRLYVRRL